MRIWITVSRGESAADSQIIARSADPALARQVLAGLVTNRLLEDDAHDWVASPDFVASAKAAITALNAEIRRVGRRAWPAEGPKHQGPPVTAADYDA